MKTSGIAEELIPDIGSEEAEEEEEDADSNEGDNEDEDGDSDEEQTLKPGFLREWWEHFKKIPISNQPHFLPTTGYKDSFLEFSEEAILKLLWSGPAKSTHYN
jgi:hypothetical protein